MTTTTTTTAATLNSDDELHALDGEDIRARKRPVAIVLVWLWELLAAFLIALPIQSWANHDWGAHPNGDAELFKPGAHALMSWLGSEGPGLSIVVRTSFILLFVFGFFGQIVTGALIASLATSRTDPIGEKAKAPRLSSVLAVGVKSFFPLVMVGALVGAIEGFFFGVGYFASSSLDNALAVRLGDARSFTVRLIVLALFVVLTLIVGVIGDLARVAIARNAALGIGAELSAFKRVRAGLRAAIQTTRAFIGRAAIAWGWRALLAIGLIYVGSLAGDIVGAKGGGALWLLFVVHQGIIFARAALRASWLANALRFVTRADVVHGQGSAPTPRSSAATASSS